MSISTLHEKHKMDHCMLKVLLDQLDVQNNICNWQDVHDWKEPKVDRLPLPKKVAKARTILVHTNASTLNDDDVYIMASIYQELLYVESLSISFASQYTPLDCIRRTKVVFPCQQFCIKVQGFKSGITKQLRFFHAFKCIDFIFFSFSPITTRPESKLNFYVLTLLSCMQN